jgi:hypothetical protein
MEHSSSFAGGGRKKVILQRLVTANGLELVLQKGKGTATGETRTDHEFRLQGNRRDTTLHNPCLIRVRSWLIAKQMN